MKLCRLLTDEDRRELKPEIEAMRKANPELMSRKIDRANVQQAWVLQRVLQSGTNGVLCIGCFEDTAFECLSNNRNMMVMGVDPQENFTLLSMKTLFEKLRFPCAFACSVIEHVEDDAQFLRDMCDCLLPGGVGILTLDFKADYVLGDTLPSSNVRFYTQADIERLTAVLAEKKCAWTDEPDLSGGPDFELANCKYSFLGLVFEKAK